MSQAIKQFNELIGPINRAEVVRLMDLAKTEGQTQLYNRLSAGLEAAKGKNIDRFNPGQLALEEIPTAYLAGMDPVPDYISAEDFTGLNKAVSPDDVYQYVTDLIINTIEQSGELPWQKGWKNSGLASGEIAYNYISKKDYRGINFFLLNFEPKPIKGTDKFELVPINYENPAFLTFKQIEDLKGKLKKGSKGHRVMYFTRLFKYEQAEPQLQFATYDANKLIAWLNKNKSKINLMQGPNPLSAKSIAYQSIIPILKYYNVFNAGDVEGVDFEKMPPNPNASKTEAQKIEVAEAIVKAYPNPPKIKYVGDQPKYVLAADTVYQTPIAQFESPQQYYSVLFHELTHSTGAEKRLNRKFGKSKSDPLYAKEELVAEMGAVFLCAESGILFTTLNSSAAYLKSWNRNLVKAMKTDNRLFFSASSKAQAAADHILDRNKEGVPAYLKTLKSDPAAGKQEIEAIKGKTPKKEVTTKEDARFKTHLKEFKGLVNAELKEYTDLERPKRKYRLGDMYRSDFDYLGLLKYASKIDETWPISKLEKLHDSFEDNNYHSIAKPLWLAIVVKKSGSLKTEKWVQGSLFGSWHAKTNKYRHTTDEKQQLKPGYKYVKGGDIVNIKTGKVYKGKLDKVMVKPKKVKKAQSAPKKVKSVQKKTESVQSVKPATPPVEKIQILKTSPKGAMLISDGKKVAWIMPKQKRPDGTFTPGALKALEESKVTKEQNDKSGKSGSGTQYTLVKYEYIVPVGRAYKITSFNGQTDFVPQSAVIQNHSGSTKSDSVWVASWALKGKDIQYGNKTKYFEKGLSAPDTGEVAECKRLKKEYDIEPKTPAREPSIGGSPRAPLSGKKPLKASDIANMEFEILPLHDGWEHLFQTAPKNMRIAVWAKPKNGKTAACCDFAAHLTKFGPVLYNFADQGINLSTKNLILMSGLDQKPNAFITTTNTIPELIQDIENTGAQHVFIDMINQYMDKGVKAHEFKDEVLKRFPDVGFTLVMEVTKAGNFKGDQAWTHLVDQLVTIDNYIMDTKGRYGNGEKISWEEGAQKYNPSRYEEIKAAHNENEAENEVESEYKNDEYNFTVT